MMKLHKILNQDVDTVEDSIISLNYNQKDVNEKTIIAPLIFVSDKGETYRENSIETPTLANLATSMFADANLEIMKNSINPDFNNIDQNYKDIVSKMFQTLNFNNTNIIINLITNSIKEMATINFYSFYDNSSIGASEIGSFFDIKRKFKDSIANNIFYVDDFIYDISYILNRDKMYYWNEEYIEKIKSGNIENINSKNIVSPDVLGYIYSTAIQISMKIGSIMCSSMYDGLSEVLCDVISTPNINTIYKVLINSDKNLKALYEDPATHNTFGEIATCSVAQYFIPKIYEFCQTVINKNVIDILFSALVSAWFVYDDKYRIFDDLSSKSIEEK